MKSLTKNWKGKERKKQ